MHFTCEVTGQIQETWPKILCARFAYMLPPSSNPATVQAAVDLYIYWTAVGGWSFVGGIWCGKASIYSSSVEAEW